MPTVKETRRQQNVWVSHPEVSDSVTYTMKSSRDQKTGKNRYIVHQTSGTRRVRNAIKLQTIIMLNRCVYSHRFARIFVPGTFVYLLARYILRSYMSLVQKEGSLSSCSKMMCRSSV